MSDQEVICISSSEDEAPKSDEVSFFIDCLLIPVKTIIILLVIILLCKIHFFVKYHSQ